tara:strand:+ start:268 stop:513 length:246 start_codon:yes stop_codon:yes gene_type:complete
LPPIPLIKIPEKIVINNVIYSFNDGHNRYNSAVKAGLIEVPCILYDKDDDLKEVSRLTGGSTLVPYDTHVMVLESFFEIKK